MVFEATDSRRSPTAGAAVHGHRLSSVVPSLVTGEDVDYELSDADLLHKLHYLRAAHYFRPSDAVRGLTTRALKEPMFPWLDMYFPVSGRLRRRAGGEGGGQGEVAAPGRPYVRCNDCGVRVIEATCDATVDQWLEELPDTTDRAKLVTYDKVIGPELFFSPLLYVQITNFKCGGLAVGFTWAHLIGDVPSAAACFSKWAQLVSGKKPPAPTLRDPGTKPDSTPPVSVTAPSSVKLTAGPVGDHWVVPTTHDMATFTYHVTEQQLKGLQLHAPVGNRQVGPFELISALMWQALAKIRSPEETSTVTVVKSDASARSGRELSNEQRVGHVAAGSSPAKIDVAELAALLADALLDEAGAAAAVAAGGDVVLYGANLTFLDIAEVDVYGVELGGQHPVHVEYAVDGVGDGGAAVVHRDAGGRGRTVTAVVRRDEVDVLRDALRVA